MAEENIVVENETVETPVEEKVVEKPKKTEEKSNVSLEEQIKALMVENAKLKKATDKATSEASSFKKQLREKQSADEIALQEKAERELEREEQFQQLLKENSVNKLEKNFLALGYPSDLAHEASVAQYEGDTDALFKIQKEVQDTLIKKKEAEWLRSRPTLNAGIGNETTNITKEQFDKMGYLQMKDFKAKYPETYKAYTS